MTAYIEPNQKSIGWSDERIARMKQLWKDGCSARQISKELGGITRSAVLGKIHRLGLSRVYPLMNMTVKKKKSPKPQIKSAPRKSAVRELFKSEFEPFTPKEEIDISLAQRKSMDDLEPQDCRWPLADSEPRVTPWRYCGREKVQGLPYCEDHAVRAFQPPQPRANRPTLARGGRTSNGMGEGSQEAANASQRAKERV